MSTIYFTVTGTSHYFGTEFLEKGMKLRLVKEPDNEHDREAIRVELAGLGKLGYVANSPYTVQGESFSAGRLYDRIGDTASGEVLYKLPKGVLCTLDVESVVYAPPLPEERSEDSPSVDGEPADDTPEGDASEEDELDDELDDDELDDEF